MTRAPPSAVDVWFLDPSGTATRAWIDVLDPEERARAEAFRTPDLREQYVASHAMVRTVLSTYASVAPSEWRYAYGSKGQPRLVDAPVDLRFSLSHSGPRAAVAITVGREVGFDLEDIDPAKNPLGIADRFFTPTEAEALRACLASDRSARFTTLWTVKEAVLKARGVGLGSGLGTVEIDLDDAGSVRAVAGPEGPWTVRSWAPEPELRAAVAVRDAGPVRVRTFRIVPLGAARPAEELGPPEQSAR
ncbi:MAG: 4'-phosphopantetheinyl transferase family protein [Myxococcaceae bacterium]